MLAFERSFRHSQAYHKFTSCQNILKRKREKRKECCQKLFSWHSDSMRDLKRKNFFALTILQEKHEKKNSNILVANPEKKKIPSQSLAPLSSFSLSVDIGVMKNGLLWGSDFLWMGINWLFYSLHFSNFMQISHK